MTRITLTRYLVEKQRERGLISAELRLLLEVCARACKAIATAVGKGALAGVLGDAGSSNVQGEAQKKLDVIANDILLEANEWGGHLAAMASEEMDHPYAIPGHYPRGGFLLIEHRRQYVHRHDLLGLAGTRSGSRRHRGGFHAGGPSATRGGLCRLRSFNPAGADGR